MIKRDENGTVVEFEDEADMATSSATKVASKGQASPNTESTREGLERVFNEEVAAINTRTEAELRGYVIESTSKVSQIEKDCDVAKQELRKALQDGINETNQICQKAITTLKADHEVALAAVRKSRYEALNPLQVAYDLKIASLKNRQDVKMTAARKRLDAGLERLMVEQESDDKLAAVVSEESEELPQPPK